MKSKLLALFLVAASAAFGAAGDLVYVTSDPIVFESRTLTAGVGLSGGGDLSSNRTITFDATELDTLTWDGGTASTIVWNFDVSGTDTAFTFGNGSINVSTGSLQVAGVTVTTTADAEFLNCDSPTELTISTGAITTANAANTLRCYAVDTESDASSDALTTVNCTAGSWALFTAADDARTVVVTDGAGVLLPVDFNLDHTSDTILLHCSASNTVREVSRVSNGS